MGTWDGNGFHPREDEYYEPSRRFDAHDFELEDDTNDPSAGGLITWFDPYPGKHQSHIAWSLSTTADTATERPQDKGGWGAPSPAKPKPKPRILAVLSTLIGRLKTP
jgi:hypothetical protein